MILANHPECPQKTSVSPGGLNRLEVYMLDFNVRTTISSAVLPEFSKKETATL